jgi:hypothetical protein
MLSLSKSLTNHEVYAVFALIAGHGKKYRLALTHPYNAEAATDTSLYKRWLWQQMQKPHCATYKHLAHLARAHQAGKRIIIQVHQNARHGEIILAALHYLTDHLPPLPKARPQARYTGSAHFQTWSEQDDDELIDERRFVWISSQNVTHLGYIWDTEGLLTALVPSFGLVKLERPGPFWLLRYQGRRISRRIHTATVTLGGDIEHTFGKLIRHQQAVEQTDIARQRLPYSGHGMAGSTLPYDERYDSWQLDHEETEEETQDFASQQRDPAQPFLDSPKPVLRFHDLLPTAYRGEHVKPVIKTKPDGSQWVLTPQMQARGVLHLYQPL